MRGTEDEVMVGSSELCNLRFLAERQLRVIAELDSRGLDGRDARALLTRLMRRHEELRPRPPFAGAAGDPSLPA